MRLRRLNTVSIIVLLLIAIGIIAELVKNTMSFLLPIIIVGGIILLYKYPPPTWFKNQGTNKKSHLSSKRSAKPQNSKPRSKTMPFRVIEGGKDSDDDTPKYH